MTLPEVNAHAWSTEANPDNPIDLRYCRRCREELDKAVRPRTSCIHVCEPSWADARRSGVDWTPSLRWWAQVVCLPHGMLVLRRVEGSA